MHALRVTALARLLALVLAAMLALAGCGGDDDGETTASDPSTGTAADDDDGVDDDGGGEPGDIDCDAAKDAQFELAFSVQFLASLVSNAQFEALADGAIDVDFGAVRSAIEVLRPLDDVENPLGSVDESLDRFDRVAELAAQAAMSDDPESTEAFAEIQTLIEDDASFIGGMGPVNYAYGDACQTGG